MQNLHVVKTKEVKKKMEKTINKGPEKKFRCDGVSLTVWRNTGENGTFRSFVFERSYLGKDEQWKTTSTLREKDLISVAKLLDASHDYLHPKKEELIVENDRCTVEE